MNRRTLLTGGLALTAALGGVGWALFRERQQARFQVVLDEQIWSQQFERPEGGTLSMASLQGRPLLLNFWATWCPPCVKEMPLLSAFHARQGRTGWQVAALAVDNAEPVRRFLERSPVAFPSGLVGFGGLDLAFALGNDTRQLPFSVLFDRRGALMSRKLGAFTEDELAQWETRG